MDVSTSIKRAFQQEGVVCSNIDAISNTSFDVQLPHSNQAPPRYIKFGDLSANILEVDCSTNPRFMKCAYSYTIKNQKSDKDKIVLMAMLSIPIVSILWFIWNLKVY